MAFAECRTRKDWARHIKQMHDDLYPEVMRVRLVMDNLNTHNVTSLYEAFTLREARRLAERLEIHYMQKQGNNRVIGQHKGD